MERGVDARRERAGVAHDAIDHVGGQTHPAGPGQRRELFDQPPVHAPRLRHRADDADRRAGERGHPGLRADQEVLLPEDAGDVGRHLRGHTGGGERRPQALQARARAPVELAERQPPAESVDDDAGRLDRGEHPRHATHGVPGAQAAGERVLIVHAVLQRHDRRLRADRRADGLGRRGRVERLHAEEDDVDGRQLARVVRRVDLDRPFAVGRRAHAQPVAPDRIQVRPAGQEAHRHAGPGQPRAEEPTHPTGADHEHAHHHHPRCLK